MAETHAELHNEATAAAAAAAAVEDGTSAYISPTNKFMRALPLGTATSIGGLSLHKVVPPQPLTRGNHYDARHARDATL